MAQVLELAACWPRSGWWAAWLWWLVGYRGLAHADAGFSSTQNCGPSVGGCKSNSMIATAVSANWESRSFIHVLKAVQANLVPLEDDTNRAFAGMAHAQFGMGSHVLRQVFDAPVGLPSPRRIDLGGFLAGQPKSRAWMSAWYWRGGGHLGRSVRPAWRCSTKRWRHTKTVLTATPISWAMVASV